MAAASSAPLADLSRLLKTLGDPTRLRILRLLAEAELSVMELAEVAQLSQPRISNHLKVLREEGLVQERRQGPWRHYRLDRDLMPLPAGALWDAASASWANGHGGADDEYAADRARLERVLAERCGRDGGFFEGMAGQWDGLRNAMFGDTIAREILRAFVPQGLVLADIGSGTGYVLELFGDRPERFIAIDNSDAMLSVAREKVDAMGLENVEFRLGDAHDPPLAAGEVDFLTISMVMHYVEDPARVIASAARALRPGGRLFIADFARHNETWLREVMAHRWLGFTRTEVEGWLKAAGLALEAWAVLPGRPAETPDGRRVQVPDGFAVVAGKGVAR
ncbi:MAG: metalloregulator ArsR/SmtB family transcription factor [Sumerlaeia bacterium]